MKKILLLILLISSCIYSQGLYRKTKALEDTTITHTQIINQIHNLTDKGIDSLAAHTSRMNAIEAKANALNDSNYVLFSEMDLAPNLIQDSMNVKLNRSESKLTWKTGIATKNINDASTTQNIAHNLGRTPVFVKVTAICVYTAAVSMIVSGTYDGTNHAGLCMIYTEGTTTATIDNIYNSTSAELGFATTGATNPYSGANRQTGVITVTSTNIVITWTKAGTVNSNTVFIQWEVY